MRLTSALLNMLTWSKSQAYFWPLALTLLATSHGQAISAPAIVIEPEVLVLKGAPGDTVTGLITIKNNKPALPGDPDYNKLLLTIIGDVFFDWTDWQRYFNAKRRDAAQAEELYEYNQSLSTWSVSDIQSNVAAATYNPVLRAGESITMLVMIGPYPDLEQAGIRQYNYELAFSPEEDYFAILNKVPMRVEITHPGPVAFKDATLEALLDRELTAFFSSSGNASLPVSFSAGEPIRPYHLAYLTELFDFSTTEPAIQRLDGLEHAINLRFLSLPNKNISSIEPLRGLRELEDVGLQGNQISDISPLASLLNPQIINVRNNWIDTTAGSPAATLINQFLAAGATVYDSPQRAGMRAISTWSEQVGLPEDKLEPEATNGPLQLPNALAFAMGIDPFNPTPAELPNAGRNPDPAEPAFVFRYKRDLKVLGLRTVIEATADLQTWTEMIPDSLNVVTDDGNGVQIVEASFNTPGTEKLFFRLRVQTNN